MVLGANSIDTWVLPGIATSGTGSAGYHLVVVADRRSDRDPEVHRAPVAKVFPKRATVTTAEAVGRS
jgi:hypothetical protein